MTESRGLTRKIWPSVVITWLQDGIFIMPLDELHLGFWRHALDCSVTACLLLSSGSVFRFCLSGAALCMTAHCATRSNEAVASDFLSSSGSLLAKPRGCLPCLAFLVDTLRFEHVLPCSARAEPPPGASPLVCPFDGSFLSSLYHLRHYKEDAASHNVKRLSDSLCLRTPIHTLHAVRYILPMCVYTLSSVFSKMYHEIMSPLCHCSPLSFVSSSLRVHATMCCWQLFRVLRARTPCMFILSSNLVAFTTSRQTWTPVFAQKCLVVLCNL